MTKKISLTGDRPTGPLHIAAAVGTEVIGLYPPVTAMIVRRWGPYGQVDSCLTPDIAECSKCTGFKCASWNCMVLISVEKVWTMAKMKLKRLGFS